MAHNRNLSSFSTYEEYKKLNEEIDREIDESIQKYDALRAEADKIWRESQVTFFQLNEEFQKRLNQNPGTKSFSPPKNK